MRSNALRDQILAFDPGVPIERASTPPSSWYTDPAVAELESRAVWSRSWQLVALSHQLVQPGDFVATEIGDRPLVVVRGADGELRAFDNVCRHKAAVVCDGAGNTSELVCPYHGWRYRLDGSLKSAPQLGAAEDFDRDAMGLTGLRVETWGPWVLINADPEATPLAEQVRALADALELTGLDELRYHGHRQWIIDCNWKAFCDNYLDGGYHIPHMHPSLDTQLDMASYRTELYERFNLQTASAGRDDGGQLELDPAQRIGDGALYAWVYPNLMINRYGPVLDTNLVRPLGPERCLVRFDWWFDPSVDQAFIDHSVAQSDLTQGEDIAVSERVQRGLRSPAYSAGRYAPALEIGVHHFHRLLAADLRAALAE